MMTRTLSGGSPAFLPLLPGGLPSSTSCRTAVRRIPALSASAAPDRKEASFSSGAAGWTTGTFLIKTPSGHRFSVLSLARLFRLLSSPRRPRRFGSSLFITGFGKDGLLAYDSLENGFVPVRALVRTPGAGGMRRLVFSEGRLLDAFPGCRILTDGWRRVPLRALGKSFTGTLAFSQPTPGPDAICDTPELTGRMRLLGYLSVSLLPDRNRAAVLPLTRYTPMLDWITWICAHGKVPGLPDASPAFRDGRFILGGSRCARALRALFTDPEEQCRHIPALVFRRGTDDRREFLTGLIEGCGAFHTGHGTLRLSPGGPEAAVQTMLLCHSLGLAASMSLADGVPVVDMSPDSDTAAGLLSSGLVPEHAVKQAAWSQASRVRILTPSSCAESYDVITESGGIDLNGIC